MNKQEHKKKQFTLLELLLVISVMIILMSLLLPALSNVKKSIKRTACANNLRQISCGAHLYSSDFDGSIVMADDNTSATHTHLWPWLLISYVGGQQIRYDYYGSSKLPPSYNYRWKYKGGDIFYCPALEASPGMLPTNINYTPSTYAINHYIAGDLRLSQPNYNISSPAITAKATKLLFFGERDYVYYLYNIPNQDWGIHPGFGTNAVFLDGHLESAKVGNYNNSENLFP
ncbi:MAG: hypothetical protein A2020_08320 [Lentisphaerae bacterium GWF2_45_14]|nr:MAG: hypothetical protein A2020_08320 [Lentisphaerae bacterium GWF2_45_14]